MGRRSRDLLAQQATAAAVGVSQRLGATRTIGRGGQGRRAARMICSSSQSERRKAGKARRILVQAAGPSLH